MKDQMMSNAKRKNVNYKKVETADDFIEKWHVWYKGHKENMRGDLINVVNHNRVGVRLNKTDLIGL